MSTEDQELAKHALESAGIATTEKSYKPELTPPPDNGWIPLPNGCALYWRMTEQGREYVSDEVGGGVQVWHTALVDDSTLLAAIVKEMEFRKLEYEIAQRKKEDGKR
jgi:hypothetical protein